MTDDDEFPRESPPSVIGAVAAAVAPLPFLAVYSVVFIAHGIFYPVQPPDITRTRTGETIAGFGAVAVALVLIVTIWWFLTGRRRWTFALAQLTVLATTIAFIADPNTGSPTVPLVLVVTSAAALVLAFLRGSNEYMGSGWQPRLRGRSPRPTRVMARRAYRGARRADAASEPREDVSV
ncbi:MAG TPA: hypothetical protein VGN35_06500 [Jatrophihabitantaceae bacterium]|jgi:hypothetical protein|nr:hypothetical protein [Jatrophihabitantaceae bacterium]